MPVINFQVKSELVSEQLLSTIHTLLPNIPGSKELVTLKRFVSEELAIEKHLGVSPKVYRVSKDADKALLFKKAWQKMDEEEKKLFQIWQVKIPDVLPDGLDSIFIETFVKALSDKLDTSFISSEKKYQLGAKASAANIARALKARNLIECNDNVWAISKGQGVVIAVMDSGLYQGHPDIDDQIYRDASGNIMGRNFTSDDVNARNNWADTLGHGTHVSGIIAAEKGNPGTYGDIIGIAPGAKIMPIKAFNDDEISSSSMLAAAFYSLTSQRDPDFNKIQIINNSWYYADSNTGELSDPALRSHITYVIGQDIICVFAAGNGGSNISNYWVVNTPSCIVVGASDENDEPYDSNVSPRITIAAPGKAIYSLRNRGNNLYFPDSGTSMAAAYVSGAIALYLAAKGGARIPPQQIIKRLRDRNHSDEITNGNLDDIGRFRLNCRKFLSAPL